MYKTEKNHRAQLPLQLRPVAFLTFPMSTFLTVWMENGFKKAPGCKRIRELWCRWWDLNPHALADNRF